MADTMKSWVERQLRLFEVGVLNKKFNQIGMSLRPLQISKYTKGNAIYPQNNKYTGTSVPKYSTLIYDVTGLSTVYATLTTDNRQSEFAFVLFADNTTDKNVLSRECVTKIATEYVREKLTVPQGATVCIVTYLNTSLAYIEAVEDDNIVTPITDVKQDGGYSNVLRKCGIIGDSLSCGALDTGNTARDNWEEYSWAKFMSRRTGCDLVKLGQGGLQVSNWLSSPYPTNILDSANICDSYFIMIGHNDQSTLSGSISDVDTSDLSQSADTTYGKLGKIVGKCKQANPKAKIFFITYPLIMCENTGINTMLREVCNKVGGYLIDLYAYDKQTDYFKDSTHLTPFGYYTWSVEIMSYVDYIMRNNMADFRDIGYVTKDYTLEG